MSKLITYKKEFIPQKGYSIKDMLSPLEDTDFPKYLTQMRGVPLSITLEPTAVKSEKLRMYAYYEKVVLGIAILMFTDLGWEMMDKNKADEFLKEQCATIPVYNSKTDEKTLVKELKSRMPKERLSKFITDCILFLEENGYRVPESEEYKAYLKTGERGFSSVKHKKQ